MDYKTSMTEGSIWKKMLFFCIPLILGNLFQQLYSTVDSIIVGRVIGESALAAVGACDPVISFVLGICAGVSGGAGVVISQYYGAKDHTALKKAVHTTVAIGAVIGLAVEVVTIILVPLVLRSINTPDDVIDQAVIYLRTYFGGMLFTVLFNMAAGILNAVGNSKRSLLYLSIASVANIILDLLFVVNFEWGIFGAAFATLLSQTLACVYAMVFLFRSREPLYRIEIDYLRPDRVFTEKIFRIGFPSSVQNMVRCFANIVVQASINGFGSMAMAGYAAYIRVDNIIWLPLMSIGMAASTFTGQNIGAGKYDRVKKGVFVSSAMSAAFTVLISIVLVVFREPVIRLFNDNPDVVRFGVITLMVFIPPYFIFAIYNSLAGVITGAGRTVEAMCISIGTMCILRLAMLGIINRMKGSFAVLLAIFPVTWVAALAAILIYMWRADWMGTKTEKRL